MRRRWRIATRVDRIRGDPTPRSSLPDWLFMGYVLVFCSYPLEFISYVIDFVSRRMVEDKNVLGS